MLATEEGAEVAMQGASSMTPPLLKLQLVELKDYYAIAARGYPKLPLILDLVDDRQLEESEDT